LLFVQSNVSPLNDTASEQLKKIGEKLDSNSIRLVQNMMDARNWVKEDKIKDEFVKQLIKGKKDFTDKLDVRGVTSDTLSCDSANLGIAYDVTFHPDSIKQDIDIDDLQDKSGYDMLEKNLRSDIEANGKDKHDRQCKKQLDNVLEEAQDTLKNEFLRVKAEIEEENVMKNSMTDSMNRMLGYNREYSELSFRFPELFLSRKLDDKIRECVKDRFDKTKGNSTEFASIMKKQQNGKAISIDKYNEFLNSVISSSHDAIINILKDAYFDDLEYKALSEDGEERERLSIMDLMNIKIKELRRKGGELNSISLFPKESESLRDFLIEDIASQLKRASTHRVLSKPKFFINSDKVNDAAMEDDCNDIIMQYQTNVKLLFKGIIKGMMAKKLNDHNEECLKTLIEEKKQELDKIEKYCANLEEDGNRLMCLCRNLSDLKNKTGGIIR
jgi:hypothetical protein